MPIIKSKSKFDKSSCSFEKDGMTCGAEILKDQEYLYDTDKKKGYCCKHEELNKQVTTAPPRQGGGGWKGGGVPLCRSPAEAEEAINIWHTKVMPLIKEKTSELVKNDTDPEQVRSIFESIARTYQEIFLGKFTPSQIAK